MNEQRHENPATSASVEADINCDGFEGTTGFRSSLRSLVSSIQLVYQLDLTSLEGITVFQDYQEGLSRFNTGTGGHLTPAVTTSGNDVVGMTPIVLRSGLLKSHVLLPRKVADAALTRDESAITHGARYAIAHELAHSDDHKHAADRFPEEVIEMISKQSNIDVSCRAICSEYYVCRKVAQQYPAILSCLEEIVVRAFDVFDMEIKVAKYNTKPEERELAQSRLIGAGLDLFNKIARLLGQLDGTVRTFDQDCKTARDYVPECVKMADLEDLRRTLSNLWDRRGQWKSLSETKSVWTHLERILNRAH